MHTYQGVAVNTGEEMHLEDEKEGRRRE